MHKLNSIFHWAGNGAADAHAVQPPRGGNTPMPPSALTAPGQGQPLSALPAPRPWPGSISTFFSQGSSRCVEAVCLYYKDHVFPSPPACAASLQASPRSRAQTWRTSSLGRAVQDGRAPGTPKLPTSPYRLSIPWTSLQAASPLLAWRRQLSAPLGVPSCSRAALPARAQGRQEQTLHPAPRSPLQPCLSVSLFLTHFPSLTNNFPCGISLKSLLEPRQKLYPTHFV